ncbi:MAG: hypothetical protein V5A29_17500, partial [Haloarculaceae archaeon]
QTTVTRSMARPVCLKWDDDNWSESPRSVPNEEHTNPQVASVGRQAILPARGTLAVYREEDVIRSPRRSAGRSPAGTV